MQSVSESDEGSFLRAASIASMKIIRVGSLKPFRRGDCSQTAWAINEHSNFSLQKICNSKKESTKSHNLVTNPISSLILQNHPCLSLTHIFNCYLGIEIKDQTYLSLGFYSRLD